MWGLALLTGCGVATGKVFEPLPTAADKAVVYIYMPPSFLGGSDNYYIHIDGRNIGHVNAGGFLAEQMAPGPHTVEVRDIRQFLGGKKTEFATVSGQSTYVKLVPKFDGMAYNATGPIPIYSQEPIVVAEAAARAEISGNKDNR